MEMKPLQLSLLILILALAAVSISLPQTSLGQAFPDPLSGDSGCVPDCYGKVCGSDNCLGSCGACPMWQSCEDGKCVCHLCCKKNETRECGTNLTLGICRPGIATCSEGEWGGCKDVVYPQIEDCSNNLDDDCDGTEDCSDDDCSDDAACLSSAAGGAGTGSQGPDGNDAGSLLGDRRMPWYLARAFGLLAFGLLAASSLIGLFRMSLIKRFGRKGVMRFHCWISLVSIAFALIHGLLLILDTYVWRFTLDRVFLPVFSSGSSANIAWGIIGLYLMAFSAITGFFFTRLSSRVGHRAWIVMHCTVIAAFLLVVVHSYFIGTDVRSLLSRFLLFFAAGLVLIKLAHNGLKGLRKTKPPEPKPAAEPYKSSGIQKCGVCKKALLPDSFRYKCMKCGKEICFSCAKNQDGKVYCSGCAGKSKRKGRGPD
jgi:sulfoxide reductase heme-binding subunit YedZ